jgi:hypothetical protein
MSMHVGNEARTSTLQTLAVDRSKHGHFPQPAPDSSGHHQKTCGESEGGSVGAFVRLNIGLLMKRFYAHVACTIIRCK